MPLQARRCALPLRSLFPYPIPLTVTAGILGTVVGQFFARWWFRCKPVAIAKGFGTVATLVAAAVASTMIAKHLAEKQDGDPRRNR